MPSTRRRERSSTSAEESESLRQLESAKPVPEVATMKDSANRQKSGNEKDPNTMVKKRRINPVLWNVIALISAFGILLVYILTRSQGYKTRQELALPYKSTLEEYKMSRERPPKKPNKRYYRDNTLNDALWTSKPIIARKLQNIEYKQKFKHDNTTMNDARSSDFDQTDIDSDKRSVTSSAYQTTPSYTDKPTTPITTQSITTPIYTEAPTTPITTQSITTPYVTEPGHRAATTEQTPAEDPNETILLIRHKRQSGNNVTPTSPHPITSTVKPVTCGRSDNNDTYGDKNHYVGVDGTCQCGMQRKGIRCDEDEDINERKKYAVQFITKVFGKYDNTTRKDFQEALEVYYKDIENVDRVFVLPLMYDPITNKTELNYIVFFKNPVTPKDVSTASSITSNLSTRNYPLVVGAHNVTFAVNETFYLRETVSGLFEQIPLGTQVLQNVCFIYDSIGACRNGGRCTNNGAAVCICTHEYVGPYCENKVLSLPDKTTPVLTVLLPVLVAAAALCMCCCCCWFFCRRANKGDEEYVTFSSTSSESVPTVILPRYYPFQYKQFIPGPEESVVPVIVERKIIQPVIVERAVQEPPRPVRVERILKEEIIRRPVVVERIIPDNEILERVVPEEELSETRLKATREIRDLSFSSESGSRDDLSWMFGQQSHDRFRIRRPSVNSKADSRYHYFDSKYSY